MNNFLNLNYRPHFLLKLNQISNVLYILVYPISDEKRFIDQLIQKFFALVEKFNNNFYFEK